MDQEKTATITIDDKEYNEDQLTNEQKVIVYHIKSLQQKIYNAEFDLDELKVSQKAFIDMLKSSLEEVDEAA